MDPPYQRRSVWNTEYKKFFIDSLVRNYPVPTIFLEVVISPDQPTTYRVIDGKQRLTALFEFIADKFATPDSIADLDLQDRYYSQLPHNAKVALLEYVFEVENISNASGAELNEAFDRLNRNVARLNAQELRHARFGGEFLSKVENLAEHPFWSAIGLVTPARIRRMLDVEYVSELYIVSMAGTQEGKEYLDQFYADNDVEISDEEETDRRFMATREFLRSVHEIQPFKTTRFANVADFYSLWAAVTTLVERDKLPSPDQAAGSLAEFALEIEKQATKRARDYLLSAVQGSNKKSNRDARAAHLMQVLAGR